MPNEQQLAEMSMIIWFVLIEHYKNNLLASNTSNINMNNININSSQSSLINNNNISFDIYDPHPITMDEILEFDPIHGEPEPDQNDDQNNEEETAHSVLISNLLTAHFS